MRHGNFERLSDNAHATAITNATPPRLRRLSIEKPMPTLADQILPRATLGAFQAATTAPLSHSKAPAIAIARDLTASPYRTPAPARPVAKRPQSCSPERMKGKVSIDPDFGVFREGALDDLESFFRKHG